MAFNGDWSEETLQREMSARAPECQHTMYPKSLNMPPKSNDQWEEHFKGLIGRVTDCKVRLATNASQVYWQEYMVGPLPATNATVVQPLTFPFQNTQRGKTTMHPLYSPIEGTNFLTKFGTEHEDIAQRLFNTVSSSL